MTAFSDVDGAFKSLTDTLQNRLSPFFEEGVSETWLGAIAYASAIARQTDKWNGLPESSESFTEVATALDRAARRLASAVVQAAILSALAEVKRALTELEGLLNASA